MEVHRLGSGDPDLAIVGGIHGDEPCGVRAVERLADAAPDVDRPVALVVANEAAVERGVRYVDADLNRSFPGDPESGVGEECLAADIASALDGCSVLSLHSTRSQADPFALVAGVDEYARRVVPRLSVAAAVDVGPFVDGRIFAALETIEVECGLQGTDAAAENAYRLAREFLAAAGALPGESVARELPLFRMVREIPKPAADRYAVHVANFEQVSPGQTYAAVGDDPQTAERAFHPVLLSADGYETVFGYEAERVGTI